MFNSKKKLIINFIVIFLLTGFGCIIISLIGKDGIGEEEKKEKSIYRFFYNSIHVGFDFVKKEKPFEKPVIDASSNEFIDANGNFKNNDIFDDLEEPLNHNYDTFTFINSPDFNDLVNGYKRNAKHNHLVKGYSIIRDTPIYKKPDGKEIIGQAAADYYYDYHIKTINAAYEPYLQKGKEKERQYFPIIKDGEVGFVWRNDVATHYIMHNSAYTKFSLWHFANTDALDMAGLGKYNLAATIPQVRHSFYPSNVYAESLPKGYRVFKENGKLFHAAAFGYSSVKPKHGYGSATRGEIYTLSKGNAKEDGWEPTPVDTTLLMESSFGGISETYPSNLRKYLESHPSYKNKDYLNATYGLYIMGDNFMPIEFASYYGGLFDYSSGVGPVIRIRPEALQHRESYRAEYVIKEMFRFSKIKEKDLDYFYNEVVKHIQLQHKENTEVLIGTRRYGILFHQTTKDVVSLDVYYVE